jgi:hypothetical protein
MKIFFIVFFLCGTCFANEHLTVALNKEYQSIDEHLEIFEDSMELSGLELIVSPNLGIELPFLVELSIVPEIEFKWSRAE